MEDNIRIHLKSLGFHPLQITTAVENAAPLNLENALEYILANPIPETQLIINDIISMGYSKAEAMNALDHINPVTLNKALQFLTKKDEENMSGLQQLRNKQVEAESTLDTLRKESISTTEMKEFIPEQPSPDVETEDSRLHFGGTIMLQSLFNSQFAFTEPNSSLFGVAETHSAGCHFYVINSRNEKDTGVLELPCQVSLQAITDKVWIAEEADGSVNANRTGSVGVFSTWRVTGDIDDYVYFESAMHNILCVVEHQHIHTKPWKKGTDIPPEARWKVVIVRSRRASDASSSTSGSSDVETRARKPSYLLWRVLKTNYRLAALRIRNDQVRAFKQRVENERSRLQRMTIDVDENECVICWASPRNTVILECGHMCACAECAESLKTPNSECPICRKPIVRIVEIRQ